MAALAVLLSFGHLASPAAAADSAKTRVIVQLSTSFKPEGGMKGSERTKQRDAIARDQREVKAEVGGHGRHVRSFSTVPAMVLEVDPAGLEELRASANVAAIQADRLARPSLTVSTGTIQAGDMWTAGYEGAGQTVAVLDTGVDGNHPFLSGKVVAEACYSDAGGFASGTSTCPNGQPTQTGTGAGANCPEGTEGCSHGTHVAGIAAGSADTIRGVAPAASIMAVQVFTRFTGSVCEGASSCVLSYTSDQIAAMERVYALRNTHSFAAVNMSLGGDLFTSACDLSEAVQKASIDNLLSVGIPTVIATGNDGSKNAVSAPGCISSAIAVGSTTRDGSAISSFSNIHPTMTDLLAPGSSIRSSVPGSSYSTASGTSMATPHVAGAFAVLRSRHPTATVAQLLAAMQSSGTSVVDTAASDDCGRPLVQLLDASTQIAPEADDPDDAGATCHAVLVDVLGRGRVSGSTVCASTCEKLIRDGSEVTLTANPHRGWRFKRWEGDCAGQSKTCTATVNGPLDMTVVFRRA